MRIKGIMLQCHLLTEDHRAPGVGIPGGSPTDFTMYIGISNLNIFHCLASLVLSLKVRHNASVCLAMNLTLFFRFGDSDHNPLL